MSEDVKVQHLTADQLAARLGLDRWTVYQLVKKGQAPRALHIGRRVRFRLVDVEAWEAAGGSPVQVKAKGRSTSTRKGGVR